ncbi:MAG TPA: polymer-forming cytoskeletal protein [Gemmatimonadaceae bacterium]|nr:polymer-forming cytoskeletal protein [Gemmatimonadaceae bacterium]
MRATVLGVAVASLWTATSLSGQETAAATAGVRQDTSAAVPPAVTAEDTLRFGGRVIEAGDSVAGPILVVAGDLRVRGTVAGSAVVIGGDLIIEPGGRVTGDVIAALGRVRNQGGAIGGNTRAFHDAFTWGSRSREDREFVRRDMGGALSLSLGWLTIVLVLGIGVLVFAGGYLEGVADVLQRSFWRSFFWGLAGELGAIPLLILLISGLAITIVGILLIPFAIVAYVLAATGLLTLGFLAMARLTGGGIGGGAQRQLTAKGSALRGLVIGIVLYLGMWVVAALFQWSPFVSGILRGIALAITYVAATAGFGAAILSRGGTRRDVAEPAAAVPADQASWQTPTPITGVRAARRPTPAVPRERV